MQCCSLLIGEPISAEPSNAEHCLQKVGASPNNSGYRKSSKAILILLMVPIMLEIRLIIKVGHDTSCKP